MAAGFHVSEVVPLENDEILFLTESYFTPPSWYHCKLGADKARKTKLVSTYPNIDYKDSEVVREWAVSKDGTKVPLTILRHKKIKLDGSHPVLLYGYGGYNLIQNPEFEASRRLWLEQGGVYAIAHLRGDGDFGEEWHRAGVLTKRQNAFDDFAACARHLTARKYTTSDKLAIEGASNGGTLMGAALTQNPQLFRAVVSQVGVYDMLRHELKTHGFDVPEFGTVKDPDQFKAMYAYSPYHKVVDGTSYPAILLATGERRPRRSDRLVAVRRTLASVRIETASAALDCRRRRPPGQRLRGDFQQGGHLCISVPPARNEVQAEVVGSATVERNLFRSSTCWPNGTNSVLRRCTFSLRLLCVRAKLW